MSVCAILGAGAGGQSLATLLKQRGHEVRLWDKFPEPIELIKKKGKIDLRGALHFSSRPDICTNNLLEAVNGVNLIFVVVPAHVHSELAKDIATLVTPGQTVILNPGRTAGSLEFRQVLKTNGCSEPPLIAETQTLWCACRMKHAGTVELLSVKRENCLALLPCGEKPDVKQELSDIYDNLTFACSTLHTGLENIGAILHPAPVLLNTGWIEVRKEFFPHYLSIGESLAAFLEKMDAERLCVAEAFGIKARSVNEWHQDMYECHGDNLLDTLKLNSGYASIDTPRSLSHRYIYEDVPTGLVPISELGRAAGVTTRHIDLIIDLAEAILGVAFRENGRNLKRLGLVGKSIEEIVQIFEGRS